VQVGLGYEWCGVTLYLQVFLAVQRTMWPYLQFWCSWCTRRYPMFYLRYLRLEAEPRAACCHLLLQVLMVVQLLHVAVWNKHKIINQMKRFKKCCNILNVPFLIFNFKHFSNHTNLTPQVCSCASDTYAFKIWTHVTITWATNKKTEFNFLYKYTHFTYLLLNTHFYPFLCSQLYATHQFLCILCTMNTQSVFIVSIHL